MSALIKGVPLFILFLATTLSFSSLHAVDFNPTDETTFQSALDAAENNGFDDVIILPVATFDVGDSGFGATFDYMGIDGRSLSIIGSGTGTTILDGDGDRQVMRLENAGPLGHIVVRGVTIQHGLNLFTGAGQAGGLGVVTDDGDITIELSEFLDNFHGTGVAGGFSAETENGELNCNQNVIFGNETTGSRGGASCRSQTGKTFMNDNLVIGNRAQGGPVGGFLAFSSSNDVMCQNNQITNNTARFIGGMFCQTNSGDIFASDNTVNGNTAREDAVGGMQVSSISGHILCEDNTVTNNSAGSDIGGIWCTTQTGHVSFLGNAVVSNVAFDFGIIAAAAGAFAWSELSGNVFCNNNAVHLNSSATTNFGAGGIQCIATDGFVDFINNTVSHNTSLGDPGGVYLDSNQEIFAINNTIVGNASLGTGSEVGGLLIFDRGTSTTHIYNNIVIGNIADAELRDIAIVSFNSAPFHLFNNIYTDCGSSGFGTCEAGPNDANNNNVDPRFVDPGPLALNFNLLPDSPAIGMGDSAAPKLPDSDLVDNQHNDPPDIGALAFVEDGGGDAGGSDAGGGDAGGGDAGGGDAGGGGAGGGVAGGGGPTEPTSTSSGCSLTVSARPTHTVWPLLLFALLSLTVLRRRRVRAR